MDSLLSAKKWHDTPPPVKQQAVIFTLVLVQTKCQNNVRKEMTISMSENIKKKFQDRVSEPRPASNFCGNLLSSFVKSWT